MKRAWRTCVECRQGFYPAIPRLQLCDQCRARRKRGTSLRMRNLDVAPWRTPSREEEIAEEARAAQAIREREGRARVEAEIRKMQAEQAEQAETSKNNR